MSILLFVIFFIAILFVALVMFAGYINAILRSYFLFSGSWGSIFDYLKNQEVEYSETPKSVSSTAGIDLPRLKKDFPEISYEELISITENTLLMYLHAIETGNVIKKSEFKAFKQVSDNINEQIQNRIDDNINGNKREFFDNAKIHKSSLSEYKRYGGYCSVKIQTAIEYIYARVDRDAEMPSDASKKQTKYETEWIYIQDMSKAPEYQTNVSNTCPNCGAPITNLGNKTCEYCGTAVEIINIRSWTLNKIKELE